MLGCHGGQQLTGMVSDGCALSGDKAWPRLSLYLPFQHDSSVFTDLHIAIGPSLAQWL
jgi:hypothetical protein